MPLDQSCLSVHLEKKRSLPKDTGCGFQSSALTLIEVDRIMFGTLQKVEDDKMNMKTYCLTCSYSNRKSCHPTTKSECEFTVTLTFNGNHLRKVWGGGKHIRLEMRKTC